MCLKFIYLRCYTAMHYETKIHDIDDLRKRLMQTWSDFDQEIIDAEIDHLRSCVNAGGGQFEHIL